MKNSSIIRRIDDLGRIVIPREIRRNLQVKEGTLIEIVVDVTGSIILTPYLTEAEKLKRWMETVSTAMSKDLYGIEFYFHGNAIVCVRRANCHIGTDNIGIAVCSPNDYYNKDIGKCISYCRAANMPIPDFLFEG